MIQVLLIKTGQWGWVIPLLWSPAAASIGARLVLREGFADVSFRMFPSFSALTVTAMIIVAVVVSRGRWTIRREPGHAR